MVQSLSVVQHPSCRSVSLSCVKIHALTEDTRMTAITLRFACLHLQTPWRQPNSWSNDSTALATEKCAGRDCLLRRAASPWAGRLSAWPPPTSPSAPCVDPQRLRHAQIVLQQRPGQAWLQLLRGLLCVLHCPAQPACSLSRLHRE